MPQATYCSSASNNAVVRDRHGRAWCVDSGKAEIAFEQILARIGQVFDIETAVGCVIRGDLYRRVAIEKIPSNDVSLDPGNQIQPIRVPKNRVLLDHVAGVGGRDETDSKVVSCGNETIST